MLVVRDDCSHEQQTGRLGPIASWRGQLRRWVIVAEAQGQLVEAEIVGVEFDDPDADASSGESARV
jgi:hypothetical protein